MSRRRLREPKGRRDVRPLTVDELHTRAKWGGLPPDGPELTEEQRRAWQELQEGLDTWTPQSGVHYAWAFVDPIHGDGEFCAERFREALEADQVEIARVTTRHPEQAVRLR